MTFCFAISIADSVGEKADDCVKCSGQCVASLCKDLVSKMLEQFQGKNSYLLLQDFSKTALF